LLALRPLTANVSRNKRMLCALNALFQGESSQGNLSVPPGRELATRVAEALTSRGFSTGDVAAWRDLGWIVECEGSDWDVSVLILRLRSGYWNLRVAPSLPKGAFAGHGSTSPAWGAAECYTTAQVVHECLVSTGQYQAFHWRWDLPPREEDPNEPHPRWAASG
jgi:hypothetical protein